MKVVLAIEGTDGAGKSSLARFIKRLCEQHDEPFTLIGRRGPNATDLVAKLSRILQEDVCELTALTEIALRLARENQRALQAARIATGFVVLDRFILSFLGIIRLFGQDIDPLQQILKGVVTRAHLHATIFVKCPFDVAWSRVQGRNPKVSLRSNRGELIHRRMAQFVEQDFHAGLLTGQQWLVDNSQDQAVAEQQLATYLFPYFMNQKLAAKG
jgi:thymidylate kinase